MTHRLPRALAPLSVIALLAVVTVVVAACAAPGTAGASSTPAPIALSTGSSDGDQEVASTLQIPVAVTSASGDPRLTTQITLAGGASVTVLVDTGSTGLIIEQSAVGAEAVSTGKTLTQSYTSGSVDANLSTGVLSIAGAQTGSDFEFGIIPDGSATSSLGGTQGILGIEPDALEAAEGHLASPLMALPSPFDQGMTVDVPSSGTGTITLGEPVPASGATTADLLDFSPSSTTADGITLYRTALTMCWTIAELAQNCGPTVLDSGAPRTAFNSTAVSGPQTGSDGVLSPGQSISVTDAADDAALWSFTTGTTKGVDMAVIESLGSGTDYNSGIGFYFTHVVAFDWVKGTVSFAAQ